MHIDHSLPVLVVDDFATMTRFIPTILTLLGFVNVETVFDANEAILRLRAGRYSMIISDCNMTLMSGLDFLNDVRSDEALANIPFIVVSTDSSIANVESAKKACADSYLVKPFGAQTLKAKIEEAFARHRPIAPILQRA